jgi:hypothetical protein
MGRTAKALVIGGVVLVALSILGGVTRFEFSEALLVWPLLLLVLGLPAVVALLLPQYAIRASSALAVVAGCWAAWCLLFASSGTDSFVLVAISGFGVVCFGMAAAAQLAAAVVRLLAGNRRALWQMPAIAIQAALVALVLAAAFTDFPFTLRFDHDRPAFDAAARRVESGYHLDGPARVGSLLVTSANVNSGEVLFGLSGTAAQLVYSPGKAPGSSEDGFTHLSGSWWIENDTD